MRSNVPPPLEALGPAVTIHVMRAATARRTARATRLGAEHRLGDLVVPLATSDVPLGIGA